MVENTVGKGEISPFPTVFSKDFYCRHVKTRAVCEKVNASEGCIKLPFVLRAKSVTRKEMNKRKSEIYDPDGIRTRAAQLISQYHNH